jgi:hypothetical protein
MKTTFFYSMQSAFVSGNLIRDNILVAYECVHLIKSKRVRATWSCVLKLDMHKTYDQI